MAAVQRLPALSRRRVKDKPLLPREIDSKLVPPAWRRAVFNNADLPAGEMITSRSGTPKQAIDLWVRVIKQWKQQHPDEYAKYQKWAKG